MLLTKAWLETRWRLLFTAAMLAAVMALTFANSNPRARNARDLWGFAAMLATGALQLAGSGVKSQSPAGFPEGLAGSTQFTISLPVSRLRLLTVRAAFGMAETAALNAIVLSAAWSRMPWIRGVGTPMDFARLIVATSITLLLPYCASMLFGTILDEPFSMVLAGWALVPLLWLLHRAAPAVDILRIWGAASPLVTHALPWPQTGACAGLAAMLFWAAARIVQRREY